MARLGARVAAACSAGDPRQPDTLNPTPLHSQPLTLSGGVGADAGADAVYTWRFEEDRETRDDRGIPGPDKKCGEIISFISKRAVSIRSLFASLGMTLTSGQKWTFLVCCNRLK